MAKTRLSFSFHTYARYSSDFYQAVASFANVPFSLSGSQLHNENEKRPFNLPTEKLRSPRCCRRCLIFARTSAGVFHLRARLGRRRSARRRAGKSTRAARTYGFLRGTAGVRSINLRFFRVRGRLFPSPHARACNHPDGFSSFFSLSLSLRRCIHGERLPRDPGKGTAGRDYTDNKLTRTTLSRRIIHHEGYVRARPDSATRAYLRRAPAGPRYGGFAH